MDPLIILKRVVLPAPFGPIRAVIDDFFISNETLLMALMPPKFLYRFFISSINETNGKKA